MGDAWEDEGYGGEDDWGEESVEADLEEELLEPGELDPEDADDAATDS
ncbi:MAG TPA: hypothetical protein VMN35_05895 [Gaiellaceae bacterium]|nr:hypothetical protein [Gaiellaceae bacterium]